jgi:hypothetical protein
VDEPISPAKSDKPLPRDAVDLVIEDPEAREEARAYERRKGEPQTKAPAHVYRAQRQASDMRVPAVQEVYTPDAPEERMRSEALPTDAVPVVDPTDAVEIEETAVTGPAPVPEQNGLRGIHLYDHDNPWA